MEMFLKWDIIYISKFPESIVCNNPNCKRNITVSDTICPFCKKGNNISQIVAKIRPIVLWIGQDRWYESMAFGIPLSKSRIIENKYNQPILLPHYLFLHKKPIYNQPMRAIIHQATRIEGCVLNKGNLIGRITDKIIQQKIEEKMFSWIFGLD